MRETNAKQWLAGLLGHYRAVQSVRWGPLLRRAATLLPDCLLGRGKTRGIVNVTLETTYRCNAGCSFCLLRGTRLHQKGEELSVAEIDALARDVRRVVAGFYITGGEPFVRKDAVEIVEAVKKHGLKCGVNTNGALLTEAKILGLRDAGLDYLIVSINGSAEAHNNIAGYPHAYQKATEAVQLVRDRAPAIRVALNCVITPQTLHSAESVIRFAERAKVAAVTFQHGQFLTSHDLAEHLPVWHKHFGNGHIQLVHSKENVFASCDMVEAHRRIQQVRAYAKRQGVRLVLKPDLSMEQIEAWYSDDVACSTFCYYPWTDTRVSPFGDVYVCQSIPVVVGNVRSESLRAMLNNREYVSFRQALRGAGGLFPACARCCKLYRMPLLRVRRA